ncbi:hypothetical protein P5815_30630 [Bacillus cereus]|uniref:hypothetical protein n=1 Tax=Bacillus cereus TaxID=1396 RepID=UPI00032F5679|nr:hypothetical protein [Bacillus cereus]EOO22109.1 hypothetical protein ICC_06514 [Bacillus cereus BAG1X1-1]EOO42431.1 hypothetical protein ICI_06479 [Bacillus cereus BAG1X2-1]EOO43812.1 hypothetical protein ICK_06713 [Bacillus cereus BAG1X2-2]EOP00519.1 hypothetical protein ICO_06221 [Bacillus cereus BAG2O-1]MDA2074270.1 hypothetical protein [Bacillus cereus]
MYEKEIFLISSLCVVLIAIIGVTVLLKKLFNPGEIQMTGKDVDRVIDYLHDNELKSCKLSLSENEIEISSDETSVVRKFNRNE